VVGRVQLCPIEASDDSRARILDGLDVAAPLQLRVHVIIAGPRALPRCPNGPDRLAAVDFLSGLHGDHREVAVDRSVTVRIMVDDHDQTAQIMVVPRHGDAALGGGQHIGSDAARDIDAAMEAQSRIAFRAPPIAKAGENERGTIS
jgi:hypothetical protein